MSACTTRTTISPACPGTGFLSYGAGPASSTPTSRWCALTWRCAGASSWTRRCRSAAAWSDPAAEAGDEPSPSPFRRWSRADFRTGDLREELNLDVHVDGRWCGPDVPGKRGFYSADA